MQVINVEMDDIEIADLLENLFQHDDVMGHLVHASVVEAQRSRATGDQVRRGHRIAAGKESDFVALSDEFLGQVGDNPLGPAVSLGRNAFIKRSNLCNSHFVDNFVCRRIENQLLPGREKQAESALPPFWRPERRLLPGDA